MLADDLAEVFDDELPRPEGLLCANAPAFALGAESLQALDPLVPLDALVVTLLSARTGAWRALGETHPFKDKIGNANDFQTNTGTCVLLLAQKIPPFQGTRQKLEHCF